MSDNFWGQVNHLCARRNSEAAFIDRQVKGDTWTFVHNDVSGEHLRINALARQVVYQLDGKSTLQSILNDVAVNASTDEKESLALALVTLSQLGAIRFCDDAEQERLIERAGARQQKKTRAWHNPLAVKIPLHDPDQWVSRWTTFLRPVLTLQLIVAVFLIIACAIFLSIGRLPDIHEATVSLASNPTHWWQMLIVYPVLKCLHELAHAISIKRYAGEVHEVGITLLVLMPIPYVDASDIWRFRGRKERIVVCASGMLIECLVASCAFIIWCFVEAGLVSDLAFVTAMLGAVSSLLFNANPLLKFDGYQILQDAIDIPNLAPRASAYLTYLLRRYVLLVTSARSPVTAEGERRWLISYGLSALLYRWIITIGIALYLFGLIPVLGFLLAAYAVFQLTLKPVFRALHYLLTSSELSAHRASSISIALILVLMLSMLLFLAPVPTNTRAEGIVWTPEQLEVYSPEAAEIEDIQVSNGQQVEQGQVLLTLSAPELQTRITTLEAKALALKVARHSLQRTDLTGAQSLQQDIQEQEIALDDMRRREKALTVRAAKNGRIQFIDEQLAKGRYVKAGDTLASVVAKESVVVKTVISQSDIARFSRGVESVVVRLAEAFDKPVNGQLVRHIPAGNRSLPSRALAFDGHSGIAVASIEDEQLQTVDPVFHVEVSLPGLSTVGIGGRAFVRFAHESESIGNRSVRALRQLLLRQLAI